LGSGGCGGEISAHAIVTKTAKEAEKIIERR
jgi:hypothetical protein